MRNWFRGKLEPNNIYRHKLGSSSPLNFTIIKPQKGELTNVVIKIFERDKFFVQKNGSYSLEQGAGSKDDLIATIKGKIKDGIFELGKAKDDIDLEPLDKKDTLYFPPAVALKIEGVSTLYKLVLNKDQKDEFERNDWDLRFEVKSKNKKGKEIKYKSPHTTLVKGAGTIYLDDRKENRPGKKDDNKAGIGKSPKPYSGYFRMLKRHLAVLGFYRAETQFENRKEGYTWYRYRRGNDVNFMHFTETWDDELERAVKQFHDAAAQEWRIDAASGKFVKRATGDPVFDPKDSDIKKEIDDLVIGDKSKEELIRWLGPNYHEVNGTTIKPRYRNPYIYSFANINDGQKKAEYEPGSLTKYDHKSGRIVNTRVVVTWDASNNKVYTYHATPLFVCTTGVNYAFSHLFALGNKFKNSANASVVDAVLGQNLVDGKRATPLYYNVYYKQGFIRPAFLIPWMHRKDPDRKKQTIEMLKLHHYVDAMSRVPFRKFPVVREKAELAADKKSFTTRYAPQGLRAKLLKKKINLSVTKTGLTLALQKDADPWGPTTWQPKEEITLAWKKLTKPTNGHQIEVTFDDKEDLSALKDCSLLVSYQAWDRFCEVVGRHHNAAHGTQYACKCGLHKCYKEIEDYKSKDQYGEPTLKDWNIATVGTSSSGLETSTLVIFKDKNGELQSFHSGSVYEPFKKEANNWHNRNSSEVYYLIFGVADNQELIDKKINPVILFNTP